MNVKEYMKAQGLSVRNLRSIIEQAIVLSGRTLDVPCIHTINRFKNEGALGKHELVFSVVADCAKNNVDADKIHDILLSALWLDGFSHLALYAKKKGFNPHSLDKLKRTIAV